MDNDKSKRMMSREEEIVNASADTFISCGDEFTRAIKMLWVTAFIAGAAWADKHPKNVWHQADEEPQGKYEILVQDEFGHFWLTDYVEDISHYQNGWKECAACECIIRWAYISDLLPKYES